MEFHNTVRYGDALEVLKTIPPGLVQCCVTSPPYWGLRDYSVAGQFGLEKTIDEYIERMVGVFGEVKRVLRDDGVFWLNIGDAHVDSNRKKIKGLKPKNLCMIPARMALALQADGWMLLQENIWSKPNPMPESAPGRTTTAHEKVFHLSKRPRYFYDADAIREENTRTANWKEPKRKLVDIRPGASHEQREGLNPTKGEKGWRHLCEPGIGRNKRTVWEIPTAPYPGAHFATFPPALVEPCILAGTSPRACEKCGAPWRRVTEKSRSFESGSGRSGRDPTGKNGPGLQGGGETRDIRRGPCLQVETTGWQPTCSCDNEGKGRCLVLDPFAGSGTTGEVALKHGRDYLLIELNRDYEKLIRGRLGLFYSA